MSFSVKVFLQQNPSVVAQADKLLEEALAAVGGELDSLVVADIPVVGAIVRPVLTNLTNDLVAFIEKKIETALADWLATEPSATVTPGSGQAGIISIEEVNMPEAKT